MTNHWTQLVLLCILALCFQAIWALRFGTVLILNFSNLFTTRITSPGNQFTLLSLVTKQEADSKWREKRIYEIKFFFEKNKENMQTLDVYKKEEGKIWQRKPSPSPEEGWDYVYCIGILQKLSQVVALFWLSRFSTVWWSASVIPHRVLSHYKEGISDSFERRLIQLVKPLQPVITKEVFSSSI